MTAPTNPPDIPPFQLQSLIPSVFEDEFGVYPHFITESLFLIDSRFCQETTFHSPHTSHYLRSGSMYALFSFARGFPNNVQHLRFTSAAPMASSSASHSRQTILTRYAPSAPRHVSVDHQLSSNPTPYCPVKHFQLTRPLMISSSFLHCPVSLSSPVIVSSLHNPLLV